MLFANLFVSPGNSKKCPFCNVEVTGLEALELGDSK